MKLPPCVWTTARINRSSTTTTANQMNDFTRMGHDGPSALNGA
jgi:hypothetical protein